MTSIKKFLLPVMSTCFAFILFSCNNDGEKKEEVKAEETAKMDTAKVEQPAAVVFTPFKIIMIKHTVADFEKWKAGYLAHDSMRKVYGIAHYRFGRGIDNPNMVVVIDKVDDIRKAKDFTALPDLKTVMQKAGVTGKPEFSFSEVVWNEDKPIDQKDRVMVSHKVKDYDAWKKVYDSEGSAKRMENGLIDRGLARGVDDPNMVYIVFAISDMAKAKARINSEELKKIMTDAGVTGPPQIFFYKIVD